MDAKEETQAVFKLQLTQLQWNRLLLALGYAAGAAAQREDKDLATAFVQLGQALSAMVEKS